MDYQHLVLEQHKHVLRISFNQPEKRNPLGSMTPELIRAIEQADDDPDIHCIILTGSGSAFSAGGDLEKFASYMDVPAPEHHENARNSSELFSLPARIRTPLIAAVNGAAMGGGWDFTVLAGAMGKVAQKKFSRLRQWALNNRVPMIWLVDSAGGRVQEAIGATFAESGALRRQ